MLQIKYLRSKHKLSPALVIERSPNIPDVSADARDRLRHVRNHPGPILSHQSHRDRISGLMLRVGLHPLNLDYALGIHKQAGHVRAASRMNRNALAPSDVAYDFFSANRIAAPRAVHHDVIDSLDRN